MVRGSPRSEAPATSRSDVLNLPKEHSDALGQNLSSRRRGGVLVDLASLGLQQRDLDQLLVHSNAALGMARQTGSGVIGRKLQGLQPQLVPHLKDPRIRQLNSEISAVSAKVSS
jgi:hypothetical protein